MSDLDATTIRDNLEYLTEDRWIISSRAITTYIFSHINSRYKITVHRHNPGDEFWNITIDQNDPALETIGPFKADQIPEKVVVLADKYMD